MKALVFAAGLGTRLKPFTDFHPKALVEVGGRPMLEHVMERLIAAGATEIVVNVHHFASQIISFLDSRAWPVPVKISDESDMLLDTGGGLLKAARLLGEDSPVLIHNADIYTDIDLPELMHAHNDARRALATLAVSVRNTQRLLAFDADMRMRGWTNVTTGALRPDSLREIPPEYALLAFAGVHVISPAIFQLLASYNEKITGETDAEGIHKFSIMDFYVDSCTDRIICGHVPHTGHVWCDVGKPDSLERARSLHNA
ncbi:MAG: nucleotidyltransferase family protein [Muribaculaceae bacterium]|nr:nucleotidyltransferase family protein [Muribaculaceae bacterium]